MFTLRIETDNAAFEDDPREQIIQILIQAQIQVHDHYYDKSGSLRDSNGNTVGEWKLTD